jgi:Methyltransferase domain
VPRAHLDLASYADPVGSWSTSLANLGEVVVPCIELTGARSVAEIGAYAGDLTKLLVNRAAGNGSKVVAIDPSPEPALVRLDEVQEELELVRDTSLNVLPEMDLADVVVIDGDHNYWTVSEELRLIAQRAPGADLPLILLHDVCWPHAFRDDYFAADQIPEEHRHPVAGPDESVGLYPGDPGLRPGGLPYPRSAAREGGPRNGVRTAVEDFVSVREGVRFVRVPAFFGLGVVWHEGAPWSERLAEFLEPWGDNAVLERLEANRVRLLADMHVQATELWTEREGRTRRDEVLRRLLDSSAFALAERLSRLRLSAGVGKRHVAISKEEIRRAMRD